MLFLPNSIQVDMLYILKYKDVSIAYPGGIINYGV
jgi:hypothetical protein